MAPPASEHPPAVIGTGVTGLSPASAPAPADRPVAVRRGRAPLGRIGIAEVGVPESWPLRQVPDPAAGAGYATATGRRGIGMAANRSVLALPAAIGPEAVA
ncbi:hypothetical protein ACIOWG_14915 [Streptomyces sp. NPDC087658]|uniref:hypothetical protein n=1 Tax=Streptomyces sp. NPDC087658 TaxID=3365800 RepID=UPI0038216EBE